MKINEVEIFILNFSVSHEVKNDALVRGGVQKKNGQAKLGMTLFFLDTTPEYGVILTSQCVNIPTRFNATTRNECLCGASELMAKNIGAWNEKVGHPCTTLLHS